MHHVLKYINSMPFPVTARHFTSLGVVGGKLKDGELRSAESWQTMRDEHPYYRIAEDRETWLKELTADKDGQDAKMHDRVRAFADLIEKEGVKTVYSIGSGGGVFEYFLKKRSPHIRVVCSEWKSEGAGRLRRVFLECDEVITFDALNPNDWKKVGADKDGIVFIYRNEHEFTDAEWHKMIRMMHDAGVTRVFLGLMYLLTILAFIQAKIRNIKKRLRGEKIVFVGYLRNYSRFKRFWSGMYIAREVPFPNCRGFYLKRF